MSQKTIDVKVFRYRPSEEKQPQYRTYEVPIVEGMSVLDVLNYIYENIDHSLAYYSHTACRRGVCGRCTLLVNGKPSLACQTPAVEDLMLEPLPKFEVVKDLVYLTL